MPPVDDIYVINGFYSAMRSKYVRPGASIYYFSVEWNASMMSWAEFRSDVLGATDPERANVGSMRWQIMQDWATLGLLSKPDMTDNGVHGSASPLEGLVERMNWLGATLDGDDTAQAIISAGVSKDKIKEWSKDPEAYTAHPHCDTAAPRRRAATDAPTLTHAGADSVRASARAQGLVV